MRIDLLPLLVFGTLTFAGCLGEPYDDYEIGPVPRAGEDTNVERKRILVKRPNPFFRSWTTRWVMNGEIIEPKVRLRPLKALIPESLHERLDETFKDRVSPESDEFERDKNFARACFVSLDPDVLIITVRSHMPPDTLTMHLFEETLTGAPNWRSIQQKFELIDVDSITLVYHAGEICTWSNEMYVLSTDKSIPFQRLAFGGEQCEIAFDGGKLVLTKQDVFATVERLSIAKVDGIGR